MVTSGLPLVGWTKRLPLYTPGCRPAGLAATIKLLGFMLEAGPFPPPTTSQFEPAGVLVVPITVYVTGSPVLVTVTVCEGPAVPG